jgi:molybdopterin synthase catalytic subunit
MSESEKSNRDHLPLRRAFVKASTAAAVVGFLGACKTAETAQGPPVVALTKEARAQMTATQILEKWTEGNVRFREGRENPA